MQARKQKSLGENKLIDSALDCFIYVFKFLFYMCNIKQTKQSNCHLLRMLRGLFVQQANSDFQPVACTEETILALHLEFGK